MDGLWRQAGTLASSLCSFALASSSSCDSFFSSSSSSSRTAPTPTPRPLPSTSPSISAPLAQDEAPWHRLHLLYSSIYAQLASCASSPSACLPSSWSSADLLPHLLWTIVGLYLAVVVFVLVRSALQRKSRSESPSSSTSSSSSSSTQESSGSARSSKTLAIARGPEGVQAPAGERDGASSKSVHREEMEVEVEEVDDAAIKATSKDVERRKGEQEEEKEVASLQKKKAKKQKMKRSKEEKKGEKKQKSKRRRVREGEEKDQGGLRQKVRNLLGLAKKPLYDEPSVVLLQTLWRGRVARKQLHIHKKRQRIVRELVDTEKSYVHSLYTMMTCYLMPLRARTSMLSLSDRMVPTSEQSSYFQNALRNINASLNIPTVVKLKKKRAKELLGGSGGKEKQVKDKKPLLSMQDHKTIFSQTEVIYNFNNHFLQTVQERLARWHYEQTIGDIFLSVMDFYKVYTECVNGYSAAMMTLTACESNKKFSRFMADCNRAAAEMGGLRSLPSYLIQPVQRLPRYVLLLKDLLKHTNESHPDFANLTKATQRMCDVAQMVDERHKQAELLNHMFQIQNETKGLSRGYDYATVDSAEITTIATGSLLAPHRRLTKWGKLCFSIEGKSPRMEEVQCYLFTDLLLLLSEQQSRNSPRMERTCRHRLPLLTLSLPSSLSTSKGKEDGKFLLSTSRDTFVFECQSAEEGVEWMTALRDNIRRLLEKQATFEAAKLQGSSKNVS